MSVTQLLQEPAQAILVLHMDTLLLTYCWGIDSELSGPACLLTLVECVFSRNPVGIITVCHVTLLLSTTTAG